MAKHATSEIIMINSSLFFFYLMKLLTYRMSSSTFQTKTFMSLATLGCYLCNCSIFSDWNQNRIDTENEIIICNLIWYVKIESNNVFEILTAGEFDGKLASE